MWRGSDATWRWSSEQIDRDGEVGGFGDSAAIGPAEAKAWLADMAVAAMATKGVSKAEEKLLATIGKQYGLVAADINLLVAQARKEAYAGAKGALKAAKAEKRAAKGKRRVIVVGLGYAKGSLHEEVPDSGRVERRAGRAVPPLAAGCFEKGEIDPRVGFGRRGEFWTILDTMDFAGAGWSGRPICTHS